MKQSRILYLLGDHLTEVIGRDTSHIVVNSWQNWNRLFSNIHSGKDGSSFGDTRQTLGDGIRTEMADIQQAVILLWAAPSSCTNLLGDGTRDDVTRGKIF